jgi:hypothetical protein
LLKDSKKPSLGMIFTITYLSWKLKNVKNTTHIKL